MLKVKHTVHEMHARRDGKFDESPLEVQPGDLVQVFPPATGTGTWEIKVVINQDVARGGVIIIHS